jgi:SAM-dependent methyltransferase
MLHEWTKDPDKLRREKIIAKHIRSGELVADLGCGNGRLLSVLPQAVRYRGFDLSQPMIAEATETPHSMLAEFLLADIFNFTDELEYNVVVLQDVAIHMSDPVAAVRRIFDLWSADRYLFTLLVGAKHEDLSLSTVLSFDEYLSLIDGCGWQATAIIEKQADDVEFAWILTEVT